ncbi:GNAT family N-acetyltransferase [Brevibacillus dissolubilis]|uniref:GNAT family N-acetyltransferase n=1 Tax=Brevibacillus dissolubilis TaxID=1844116 RepID=UPI001117503A|nr:GNAT family N-acetyltransferase [Brevibacillus dissolubilis]
MPTPTPFPTHSTRLTYTSCTPADLPALVDVYNSNPFYMQVSEGKPTVTLAEVERDFLETSDHNGYNIIIREKNNPAVIGTGQFILNNPRDNNPWLGLIMLHADKQGHGYAREFLQTLLGWYHTNGYPALHLAVLEQNERVVAFYETCGFTVYERSEHERLGKLIYMSRPTA